MSGQRPVVARARSGSVAVGAPGHHASTASVPDRTVHQRPGPSATAGRAVSGRLGEHACRAVRITRVPREGRSSPAAGRDRPGSGSGRTAHGSDGSRRRSPRPGPPARRPSPAGRHRPRGPRSKGWPADARCVLREPAGGAPGGHVVAHGRSLITVAISCGGQPADPLTAGTAPASPAGPATAGRAFRVAITVAAGRTSEISTGRRGPSLSRSRAPRPAPATDCVPFPPDTKSWTSGGSLLQSACLSSCGLSCITRSKPPSRSPVNRIARRHASLLHDRA